MTDHVVRRLYDLAAAHPGAPALGSRAAGTWVTQSFGELAGSVRRLANALIAERLLPSEAAVIMAPNGPGWFLAHFAVLAAGGVAVPLDPATGPEETLAIVRETEARVLLIAGERARATVERIRPRLPSLRLVVALDPPPAHTRPLPRHREGPATVELSRLEQQPYDLATAAEARRRAESWHPRDVAAVHYVPSASGLLRGVVVSHASTMYPVDAVGAKVLLPADLSLVVALPLTQAVQYWAALTVLLRGGTLWCPDPGDDPATVLREVRPSVAVTVLQAVEDLLHRATEDVRTSLAVPPEQLDRAVRTGTAVRRLVREGRPVPPRLALRHRAAELRVLGPLRARLGGARHLTLIGGQAMPPPELMDLLDLLGQAPLTGWGSLETCALATINTPEANRSGSVGRPLPGTEVRIGDRGEILVRGPGVMRGYYGRAAETRAVLGDGWLHSGQSGRIDDDGYLFLTSRVDDIIMSSSLRYTSARPLEKALEDHPLVAEAVLLGEARPDLTVLLRPDLAGVRRSLRTRRSEDRAGSATRRPTHLDDLTEQELVAHPRVVRLLGDVVRGVNEGLPPEGRIRAFRLVTRPLGSPTPVQGTAMTRRQRALQDHGELIDAMYADLGAGRRPSRGA